VNDAIDVTLAAARRAPLIRVVVPHRIFSGTDAALRWLGEGIARERRGPER